MAEPERAFVNARLIDPAQELDGSGSLLVRDGKIVAIGTDIEIPDTAETLNCTGLAMLPGLIDMQVFTGEPGEEHRETLATASHAAAAGGVTHMVVMPNTTPAIDDARLWISLAGAHAAPPQCACTRWRPSPKTAKAKS